MTATIDIADAIIRTTVDVTKNWAKQRKAEERDDARRARRWDALVRPPRQMTVKDAAWDVMAEAYQKASGNGQYPANARQIFYAARPEILDLTGRDTFGDAYFTQTVLPNYIADHPAETVDWDVVYDDRGDLIEPHTGVSVPLGTLQVREYLGEREPIGPAVTLDIDPRFPTQGPKNRYGDILFIEKQGFDPLLAAARIAERFDIAVMSTKGMSVTAARKLLDELAPRIQGRVLVLHDFDISGFSIAGTLTSDGRRYIYENAVEVIDFGLRLTDVEELGLQSEPVTIKRKKGEEDSLAAREETLREHGATEAEIDFLLGYDGEGTERVELNAMTSDVFVAFLERKLTAAGVQKIIPDGKVLREHAQRLFEQQLTKEALDDMRDEIAEKAAARKLRRDLAGQVRNLLAERPELSWDMALALVLGLG